MIFHRATKGAYQQWADLVGDDSYTWPNFLHYLEKSVQFTPPNLEKMGPNVSIPYDSSVYSKSGGPLQVSYPNYRQPFDEYLIKAFSGSGMKEITGLSSGHLDGFATSTFVFDPTTQTRSSSEASFLQQALSSTSLKVYIKTLAQKVLFDNKKRATGVQVQTNSANYTLSARKEVIVSAGVFHSPQVLMLSGIGPKDTLDRFGIPVISNLPGVGQNMWDHVFIFTSHEMNMTTNSAVLTDPILHAAHVQEYLNNQNGPLTGVGGEIIGWEKLPNRTELSSASQANFSKFPADWPELELLGLSTGANPSDKPSGNNYVSLTAAIQAILSRGYVSLRSANANDPPIVNPNALTTKAEQELAVGAIKRIRQFAAASGVQIEEITPGSNVTTDAQILNWIQTHSVNGYHAACTCMYCPNAKYTKVLLTD
jgi:choline dehydrogenase